jgi:hypothetical protein
MRSRFAAGRCEDGEVVEEGDEVLEEGGVEAGFGGKVAGSLGVADLAARAGAHLGQDRFGIGTQVDFDGGVGVCDGSLDPVAAFAVADDVDSAGGGGWRGLVEKDFGDSDEAFLVQNHQRSV